MAPMGERKKHPNEARGRDPGPPWRFFILFITAAQRPLDPLVSSLFFGGDGHHIFGTSSRAAFSLSLCDSLGHGFATPEIPPFVYGSAPQRPEDG